MRAGLAKAWVLAALVMAQVAVARNPHERANRHMHAHGRKAAWGRRSVVRAPRDMTATIFSLPTEVPAAVVGAFTVSNTMAAAPEATAAAVGADRGVTTPLPACEARESFGSSCDPTATDCCDTGLTCIANSCARLCPLATTEPYCDENYPCDASLGYVCTNSRCRPPTGAVRVALGETCDQGGANTLFCVPALAVCANGVCESCTQHS